MAREDYNDKIKNKFLTCEICSEEYDEGSNTPRQLPCLHTFCTECIERLIRQKSGNDILCPLDRKKHSIVSSKGVDTFPKDNTRRDLLEFIGNQDKSEILSKECTDNNNASYMDGAENVFGVVIDVRNGQRMRTVHYKFQGKMLITQEFHKDSICTDCKTILDLLRRANEKGVLFQKTGGNKITWNKDIPYQDDLTVLGYPYHLPCVEYLPILKQSLAKYGIN